MTGTITVITRLLLDHYVIIYTSVHFTYVYYASYYLLDVILSGIPSDRGRKTIRELLFHKICKALIRNIFFGQTDIIYGCVFYIPGVLYFESKFS